MRTFTKKPKAAQQTPSAKSPKLSRSFVGQSRDIQSILHLQRTIGNQAVLGLLQTTTENIDANSTSRTSTGFSQDFSRIPVYPGTRNTIQPKLKVNAPKDRFEQEADRIADEVLRQKPPDEEDEKVDIQAKPSLPAAGGERNISEHLENRLNRSRGSGSPLSHTSKSVFEAGMRHDLSNVRVHADSEAAQLSRELGARAFTFGQDIYFGAGQYNPQSSQGEQLLAHELTHVVQQTGNTAFLQRWVLPTDWLDYIGLGVDVVERVYIELAYEEGQEKDFQRFINTLFFAIDLILAALPGAGGGGLAIRGSRQLAAVGWGAIPDSAKLQIAEEVARQMGWTVTRATQMINRFFSVSSEEGSGGESRRTKHAEQRRTEGRRVGPAFNDAQRARRSNVYVQPDGRYVVRGQRGREHIFSPDGRHITTIDRTQRRHLELVRQNQRRQLTVNEFARFREMFR